MLKWLDKIQTAVFIAFCILFTFQVEIARAEADVTYEIADVATTLSDNAITYTISGTSSPVYNVTERFSPHRIFVDIAEAAYSKNFSPAKVALPKNNFVTLEVSDQKDQQPQLKRFAFALADTHDFSVEALGESLVIKFFPGNPEKSTVAAEPMPGSTSLHDFEVVSTPNSTTITITANGPIEKYTVHTLGSGSKRPPRMYIDIDDVAINELATEKRIGTSVDKVRVTPRDNGARIVFDSASQELFRYAVAPSPEGLNVVIDESSQAPAANTAASVQHGASSPADNTLDRLIGSSEKLLSKSPEKIVTDKTTDKMAALHDDFSFSGFKKQRISVDFYKIDIHNVFRLFRQITDLNIIVDEDVKGVLTLALNNVPWDFALDIILNLMDLKKEERFNTIVIYPSKKEFVWPTRAEDNLDFKADTDVIEQEALVIEKSTDQSKEVMQARDFMEKAQNLEKQQDMENAALFYAKAFELWPENTKLSNKLSSLYLVNLGINAKAVYYAKESLKNDPQDVEAALYAAIASANMQRIAEANEYFIQSISKTPPMKEALLSYATFSENNGHNEAALKLLDKYYSYYGETVETMVAKARIFDKLGRTQEATRQYRALLGSGYQLRPDLTKYIEWRLTAQANN